MKLLIFIFFCISLVQNITADSNLTLNLQIKDKNTTELKMPASKPKSIDFSKFQEFKNTTFRLPNNAKAISTITIKYIDELGNMREKIIDIDKTVDWNNDLIIQKLPRPVLSEILDLSVTSARQNFHFDSNISKPIKTAAATLIELPLETLKYDDGLKFAIKNNQVKIITKDRLKDSFMQPSRKVFGVELYRDDMNISAVNYKINKGGFSDINVSKEHFYYTILIGVNDGNFTINKDENGYVVLPQK